MLKQELPAEGFRKVRARRPQLAGREDEPGGAAALARRVVAERALAAKAGGALLEVDAAERRVVGRPLLRRAHQPAQEDGLGVFGAERELARAVVELEHAREHAVGAERAVGREVRDAAVEALAVEGAEGLSSRFRVQLLSLRVALAGLPGA